MAKRSRTTRPKATKIADVARLAGVSVATVSRTLARPEVVIEETRTRVLAAVRETGYAPNISARNLRARKTMVVLVAVPDIANPFFAEVLQGIDDTLSAAGYGLIIANLTGSPEKEARYVDLVCAGQADGVLLLCGHVMRSPDRDLLEARVPLVAACEYISGESFPQVTIDNVGTASEAVRHLVELGHTSIAYLSGPKSNILEQQRFEGYRQALREAGIAAEADLILPGDFTFRTGVEAGRALLALGPAARPTALFAANDEMAIGLIKTVHAAGLQVPDDLSVVGFDGIAYADYCEPTLTTIVQPRRDLGATAAAELIALMTTGKTGQRKDINLPATLMLRDSTRPPRKSPGDSSQGAKDYDPGSATPVSSRSLPTRAS
ncbi:MULTISPECIES: LacI family DNA-binding transcriptional regulator [unclassified Bradyrhizobium]|uniref:LacI family DNA-binding transcriptional regulator n=1 Tax=unclassified Bradyrhizobium TaxID=2631580 RepID=UPI0020B2D8D9|nr:MULTISPECIES: LacI family DNA-binding transcriptional regulator [unclassified Bradyrhizobium]MCP3443262.1 LacI family transcriptional regulator [Bradyrhizobium sp. CCGUVB14]